MKRTFIFLMACTFLLVEACAHEDSVDVTWEALSWESFSPIGLSDAWLSGTATVEDGVWIVGGQPGAGKVHRWRNGVWEDMSPPGAGMLWWIHRVGPDHYVTVGERGEAWTWRMNQWELIRPGTDGETLYGCWGDAAGTVWVVGAWNSGMGISGIFEKWQGDVWQDVVTNRSLESEPFPTAIYKLWGEGDEPIVAVGADGQALHRTSEGWLWKSATDTGSILFTVTGRDKDDLYAIGSIPIPALLHYDGIQWLPLELPQSAPAIMQGIWTSPEAPLYISGTNGFIGTLVGDEWTVQETGTEMTLHAVFGDGFGEMFSVGGDIETVRPQYEGVILTTDPAALPEGEDIWD